MTDVANRFEALFEAHHQHVLAYLLRRTEQPADAADVLAEVFLIAWRRKEHVPVGEEARLWLYGVARKTLANYRRGELRKSQLAERLRQSLLEQTTEVSPANQSVRDALASLPETDRDLVTLNVWEGLTPSQIAAVAGMNPVAVRVRLYRARRRLKRILLKAYPVPQTSAL